MRAGFALNPSRFEELGLTSNSAAWRLKQAAFSVAQAHAEQAPPWSKTEEGKLLHVIEERETSFELGNSIIGTALVAAPAVGSVLSEGYTEVKENGHELGAIAKKGSSAVVAGVKAGGAWWGAIACPVR